MKILFTLAVSLLALSQTSCQIINEDDCSFPWQRVNDDICLFLTSITKTWDHAKLLCNFYGGDLLFIQDESEQQVIQNYLSKLIRYRFNRKPYVWMDATDRLKESEWLWSRNNETVNYGNWIPSHHNSGPSASSLNCACYKPNNGFWKDCDCSLMQHFTCRKSPSGKVIISETPNMASFNQNLEEPDQMSDQLITETTTTPNTSRVKDAPTMNDELVKPAQVEDIKTSELMMDLVIDEKQPRFGKPGNISSELFEKVRRLGDQANARVSMLTTKPKIQLVNQISRRQPPASKTEIIMRIRLLKSDSSFSAFHCPNGFGYYLIKDSACTKYKRCEDWNDEYASLSVNKCREGMVFDFSGKQCVPNSEFKCDESLVGMFVPEVLQ